MRLSVMTTARVTAVVFLVFLACDGVFVHCSAPVAPRPTDDITFAQTEKGGGRGGSRSGGSGGGSRAGKRGEPLDGNPENSWAIAINNWTNSNLTNETRDIIDQLSQRSDDPRIGGLIHSPHARVRNALGFAVLMCATFVYYTKFVYSSEEAVCVLGNPHPPHMQHLDPIVSEYWQDLPHFKTTLPVLIDFEAKGGFPIFYPYFREIDDSGGSFKAKKHRGTIAMHVGDIETSGQVDLIDQIESGDFLVAIDCHEFGDIGYWDDMTNASKEHIDYSELFPTIAGDGTFRNDMDINAVLYHMKECQRAIGCNSNDYISLKTKLKRSKKMKAKFEAENNTLGFLRIIPQEGSITVNVLRISGGHHWCPVFPKKFRESNVSSIEDFNAIPNGPGKFRVVPALKLHPFETKCEAGRGFWDTSYGISDWLTARQELVNGANEGCDGPCKLSKNIKYPSTKRGRKFLDIYPYGDMRYYTAASMVAVVAFYFMMLYNYFPTSPGVMLRRFGFMSPPNTFYGATQFYQEVCQSIVQLFMWIGALYAAGYYISKHNAKWTHVFEKIILDYAGTAVLLCFCLSASFYVYEMGYAANAASGKYIREGTFVLMMFTLFLSILFLGDAAIKVLRLRGFYRMPEIVPDEAAQLIGGIVATLMAVKDLADIGIEYQGGSMDTTCKFSDLHTFLASYGSDYNFKLYCVDMPGFESLEEINQYAKMGGDENPAWQIDYNVEGLNVKNSTLAHSGLMCELECLLANAIHGDNAHDTRRKQFIKCSEGTWGDGVWSVTTNKHSAEHLCPTRR